MALSESSEKWKKTWEQSSGKKFSWNFMQKSNLKMFFRLYFRAKRWLKANTWRRKSPICLPCLFLWNLPLHLLTSFCASHRAVQAASDCNKSVKLHFGFSSTLSKSAKLHFGFSSKLSKSVKLDFGFSSTFSKWVAFRFFSLKIQQVSQLVSQSCWMTSQFGRYISVWAFKINILLSAYHPTVTEKKIIWYSGRISHILKTTW